MAGELGCKSSTRLPPLTERLGCVCQLIRRWVTFTEAGLNSRAGCGALCLLIFTFLLHRVLMLHVLVLLPFAVGYVRDAEFDMRG